MWTGLSSHSICFKQLILRSPLQYLPVTTGEATHRPWRGDFVLLTISPGILYLPSIAYKFTSTPCRVQFPLNFSVVFFTRIRASVFTLAYFNDEEYFPTNKHKHYKHIGEPRISYPYKSEVGWSRSSELPTNRSNLPKGKRCVSQVWFFLVGMGRFNQKCYAYT